jgi:hypothetical protein
VDPAPDHDLVERVTFPDRPKSRREAIPFAFIDRLPVGHPCRTSEPAFPPRLELRLSLRQPYLRAPDTHTESRAGSFDTALSETQ